MKDEDEDEDVSCRELDQCVFVKGTLRVLITFSTVVGARVNLPRLGTR